MASPTESDPAILYAAAKRCFAQGDLHGVETYGRRIVTAEPTFADAWFLMGKAAVRAGQAIAAGQLTEEAVALDGARADYRAQLAQCFSLILQHPKAASHAEMAMALGPEDAETFDRIGVVFLQADQPARALEALEQAVSMQPGDAMFQFNLASACRFLGDLPRAEQACQAALKADPGFHRAHAMLAELQGRRVSRERTRELELALDALATDAAVPRMNVGFALSRAYEAQGEFAKAFSVLAQSKALVRERLNYDFATDQAQFDALTRLFDSPDCFAGVAGHDSKRPIFVMGMPRSGTTLADRILSSHHEVESAGEVHNFGILLQRAVGEPGLGVPSAGVLGKAMHVDFRKLGEDYIDSVRARIGGATHFVDKLPHNFLFAGYIARALPNARMICLRRNPLDTCLGNFRQLFAINFPYYYFNFDLLDTGRYYIAFDRLIRHWQSVMPGRIYELSYEALVNNPEAEIRQLLAFCELDWDPACLSMEKNKAPVTSASAAQVREPINARAVGRWRRYASELQVLVSLLKQAGIDPE